MRVLFCNCSHKAIIPDAVRVPVLAALAAADDVDLTAVPDLCELVAVRDARLAELVAGDAVKIVACFPRAVQGLLQAAGVELDPARVEILNMRAATADVLLRRILGNEARPAAATALPDLSVDDTWVPWFPVIDYDRCSTCKQCMSFCPFGVYELDDAGRVVVANPKNCKNNCPACARICPDVAIMFPKLADAPINGAPVREEDVQRCRAVLDEQAHDLAQGDIHDVLARRKLKAAYRKLERLAREQAERERAACTDTADKRMDHGTATG